MVVILSPPQAERRIPHQISVWNWAETLHFVQSDNPISLKISTISCTYMDS